VIHLDDSLAVIMANRPAGMIALHGPEAVPLALALTARMAMRGPVWVVDGGNRFDALWVADFLARRGAAPEPVLSRIRVSRAFTCHQMAERVLSLPAEGETEPLVMLYWLDTFYDENVPLAEARRLLNGMWPVLLRRSRAAPVVLVVRPPRSERVAERARFYSVCLQLSGQRVEASGGAAFPSPFTPWEGSGRTLGPPRDSGEGGDGGVEGASQTYRQEEIPWDAHWLPSPNNSNNPKGG
jgi:hypothetical protein